MDDHRKPVGPPGLSRIEDDGSRTAQTIIDTAEYERLVAIEKSARYLVERPVNGQPWAAVEYDAYTALTKALEVTP